MTRTWLTNSLEIANSCLLSTGPDYFFLQGVVGTTSGTLWYINWKERTSIRLVPGHKSKVRHSLILSLSLVISLSLILSLSLSLST